MRLANKSTAALGAVLALVAVVFLLAVLQYQWTGAVSQAAEERLRETLRASTGQFRQEFAGELVRICTRFQASPVDPPSQIQDLAIRQYGEWLGRAPYRDLIAGIYYLGTSAIYTRELVAMDKKSFRFAAVAWPARLEALRHYLEVHGWGASQVTEREAYVFPWILHEPTPALVQTLFSVTPGEGLLDSVTQHAGFLIIELNRESLQQSYLPDLVKRCFVGREGLEFTVAVKSTGDPAETLFVSNPDWFLPGKPADAVVDVIERAESPLAGRRIALLEPASEESRWQVLVQHRAGSLAAAVAGLRLRNLGISFGLLFLLAASMALILVLARRTHRLAGMQMEFVAGVSHELRTPLAVVCSAADNLAEGIVGTADQTREYGRLIRNEGRRLGRMVEQILLFSASQANRPSYDLRPVAVPEAIDRALAGADSMVKEAQFTVEKQVEPRLPPVMGDANALNQCLENLISNAVKYGGDQRWVALRARRFTDGGQTEVRISVQDRGIGIAAADLGRVFDPFYRARAARDGQFRGVGLGLYLVKRMMDGMGGRVSVSSRPHRGSVFTLHLKTAAPEQNS